MTNKRKEVPINTMKCLKMVCVQWKYSKPRMSESLANPSTVVCQGLTASQTEECCEILAIVWGERVECRLPGCGHYHQWTQPEALQSSLPSVIPNPSLIFTSFTIWKYCVHISLNCWRLDRNWPLSHLSKYFLVSNKLRWSISVLLCIHCNDCN